MDRIGGDSGRAHFLLGAELLIRVRKLIPPHILGRNHIARILFTALCDYLEEDPKRVGLFQLNKIRIKFEEIK